MTDAHVVLGRLRPEKFLGGRMELDLDAAERAVGKLAGELGLDLEEAALGILDIADAAMSRAIKVVSLERGRDPRPFTLVSFGGAGGLHAVRLAESLDMEQVLVPNHPGLLSAWGMLSAPRQWMGSRSVMKRIDSANELRQVAEALVEEAGTHVSEGEIRLSAALRYEGQSFEIDVPFELEGSGLLDDFAAEHERLYGYCPDRPVECTAVRVETGRAAPELPEHDRDAGGSEEQTAAVVFGADRVEARIVERSTLADGERCVGPAIVTEMSGTTVIPPGWTARCDRGHLLLRRSDESD